MGVLPMILVLAFYMTTALSQSCSSIEGTCPRKTTVSENRHMHQRQNIINDLLKDYDNLMRPHFDSNETTYVTIDMFINSIDSISVETMDFSVNVYIRQEWIDPRLKFKNSTIHSNITSLTLDSKLFDQIWVPDLFFPNDKRSHAHCITMPNRLIRIHSDGKVLYSSRYTLVIACDMSLKAFPFDRQECAVRMESYGYTMDELQYIWREDRALQIEEELQLPQFSLEGEPEAGKCMKSYITGDFTCLKATFNLEREYGYFLLQNFVPSILIVILSWVSFWINIDAVPARISLGVMTVLTITTQSVGIWMSLPRVSYVKAIDVWMSVSVMFVFLAMLEFAVVNTLARKEIRIMSIRAREVHKDDSTDLIKRMMDEHTYGTVTRNKKDGKRIQARRVDKASRVIFPVTFFIFNTAYWCFYLVNR